MRKEVPGQASNHHLIGIPAGAFRMRGGHINIAAAGDAIYRCFGAAEIEALRDSGTI